MSQGGALLPARSAACSASQQRSALPCCPLCFPAALCCPAAARTAAQQCVWVPAGSSPLGCWGRPQPQMLGAAWPPCGLPGEAAPTPCAHPSAPRLQVCAMPRHAAALPRRIPLCRWREEWFIQASLRGEGLWLAAARGPRVATTRQARPCRPVGRGHPGEMTLSPRPCHSPSCQCRLQGAAPPLPPAAGGL